MFEAFFAFPGFLLLLSIILAHRRAYQAEKTNSMLEDQIEVTTAELDKSLAVLRELHEAIGNNSKGVPAELAEKVRAYLAKPEAIRSQADELVGRIDELMKKGEKIAAVGLMRDETGAVWDHIHDAIGAWKGMKPIQRHEVVSRFLRKKQLAL
jgi:hypothetical protein